MKTYLAGVFIAASVLCAGAPAWAAGVAAAATASAEQSKDFDVTPQQFRAAYNKLLADMSLQSQSLRMGQLRINRGDKADTFRYAINAAALHLVGRISKGSGKMHELVLGFADAKGDESKMLGSLIAAATSVRAATGLAQNSGAAEALQAVLSEAIDNHNAHRAKAAARTVGGYSISGYVLPSTGLFVIVSRLP